MEQKLTWSLKYRNCGGNHVENEGEINSMFGNVDAGDPESTESQVESVITAFSEEHKGKAKWIGFNRLFFFFFTGLVWKKKYWVETKTSSEQNWVQSEALEEKKGKSQVETKNYGLSFFRNWLYLTFLIY